MLFPEGTKLARAWCPTVPARSALLPLAAALSCRCPRRRAPPSLGRRCPTAGARPASLPGWPHRRGPPCAHWPEALAATPGGTSPTRRVNPVSANPKLSHDQAAAALHTLLGASRPEPGTYMDWPSGLGSWHPACECTCPFANRRSAPSLRRRSSSCPFAFGQRPSPPSS